MPNPPELVNEEAGDHIVPLHAQQNNETEALINSENHEPADDEDDIHAVQHIDYGAVEDIDEEIDQRIVTELLPCDAGLDAALSDPAPDSQMAAMFDLSGMDKDSSEANRKDTDQPSRPDKDKSNGDDASNATGLFSEATNFSKFFHPDGREKTEQDTIGWQNFLEGKISKQWRELQEQHYEASFSIRSGDKWVKDLVSHLLEFTHDIWEYRNSVCHERAANGLKRKEAEALEQDILEEFALDTANLSRRDQHYIRRGLQDVQALSASDKQAWLRGVRIARQSSAPNGLRRQRSMMDNYFSISST